MHVHLFGPPNSPERGETEPDDEETEAQRGLSSLPEVRVSKWRSLDSKSQKLAPEPQQ